MWKYFKHHLISYIINIVSHYDVCMIRIKHSILKLSRTVITSIKSPDLDFSFYFQDVNRTIYSYFNHLVQQQYHPDMENNQLLVLIIEMSMETYTLIFHYLIVYLFTLI